MADSNTEAVVRAWNALAVRFPKGASARAKMEEEQRKEAAEAAKPAPAPDPKDVLLAAWAVRYEDEFNALLGVIDGFIQKYADLRRASVHEHFMLAFHEGECASLEKLKQKLINLKG